MLADFLERLDEIDDRLGIARRLQHRLAVLQNSSRIYTRIFQLQFAEFHGGKKKHRRHHCCDMEFTCDRRVANSPTPLATRVSSLASKPGNKSLTIAIHHCCVNCNDTRCC